VIEAGLAQLVEQLICNQQVAGSSPITSSKFLRVCIETVGSYICAFRSLVGQVPEWLKGADCKSAGFGLRRFESFPVHHFFSLSEKT
jgi:hypothetical protein